jgi:uncharacterized membrane protein (DUF485 family)
MKKNIASPHGLRRNRKAVSPAVSTVILTSAVVVLLVVTIAFANNFLGARMAENEFSTMKQFMQTVGLQIDDVAWIIGRTQTIRYASKFGQVNFETGALNYTLFVDKGSGYTYSANNLTDILMFNMPIIRYSISNHYYESIFPSDRSFLQKGTSAPVSRVYAKEEVPMRDGNFIRVVVIPTIRMLNSTISMSGTTTNYFKFYLPVLSNGTSPYHSQSVTLTGKDVLVKSESGVNAVRMHVSYPKIGMGFGKDFFNFDTEDQVVNVPDGSIVEFYTSEVSVSLGLYA